MKSDYHKSFDKHQWYFDQDGKMVIPIQNQEYLLEKLKLKQIKIRPEVLNDEMISFLKQRDDH